MKTTVSMMFVESLNRSLSFFGIFSLSMILTVSSKSLPIKLTKHSEGFVEPVAVVDAKDGLRRLYVVERGGTIRMTRRLDGFLQETPFLDISSLLGPCTGYCTERGLLGLVFHPNHKENGYFYINYTSQDSSGNLETIISRFSRSTTKTNFADESSEQILLRFQQPYSNHNAGDLQFGPDGYLYITSGDGGWFGDPLNSGQDLGTILGKILRIDVDRTSPGKNYGIPSDNPFLSVPGALPEIWSFGLRNPWKISFDSASGDLFIGDVGQNFWEELNYQPANSKGGENYGWRLMEGSHCYEPANNCTGSTPLTMPILEYEHVNNACSITAGYMYQGRESRRRGSYYYADYCNGTIWAATMDARGIWTSDIVQAGTGHSISSFGEDAKGNHYLASFYSGTIYKISTCKDNKDFVHTQPRVTCKWLRRRPNMVDKLCESKEVYENCKSTCENPTC